MKSSLLHCVIHSYKYTLIIIRIQTNNGHNYKLRQLLSDLPEFLYCIPQVINRVSVLKSDFFRLKQ